VSIIRERERFKERLRVIELSKRKQIYILTRLLIVKRGISFNKALGIVMEIGI
jgi:hypothetical protein